MLNHLINLHSPHIQAVLPILLKEQTTKRNIIWATDNYMQYAKEHYDDESELYLEISQITPAPLVALDKNVLQPRAFKSAMAQNHAKYLMTRFTRALLYVHKHTQDNSKEKWAAVPVQDYSEPWWNLSIEEIDEKLMDKYAVPQTIRDFVKENIQTKNEANIVNFRGATC